MIHPSYYELMEKINEGSEMDDTPVITSRYSIVLATSKRARQLTDGAEPRVRCTSAKLLSVAIEELYEGAVNIIPEEEALRMEAEEAQKEAAGPEEEFAGTEAAEIEVTGAEAADPAAAEAGDTEAAEAEETEPAAEEPGEQSA